MSQENLTRGVAPLAKTRLLYADYQQFTMGVTPYEKSPCFYRGLHPRLSPDIQHVTELKTVRV